MLIFSGRFHEAVIEEIKKKRDADAQLRDKDLFVTASKQEKGELTKWQLSDGTLVHVYDSKKEAFAEYIEERNMTAGELKELFSVFFRERYGIVPRFTVEIDAFIWLPVVVNFELKDGEDRNEKEEEEFERFFRLFDSDMDAIINKHEGEEFEYGDKLLQLIYGNYIGNYQLIGAKSGDDAVFTEDDYSGAVKFSVYRERNVIERTYYGFNPEYTEKHKEEVIELILNGGEASVLRGHIKKGFHLNTSLQDGMHAFHLAVHSKKFGLVKALIEEAVDINRKDANGLAPLVYAVNNRDTRMIDFLLSYQAETFGLTEKGGSLFSFSENEEIKKHVLRYL